jgi:hypothetical protein
MWLIWWVVVAKAHINCPSVGLVIQLSHTTSSKWQGLCPINIHWYQLIIHTPWYIGGVILRSALLAPLRSPLVIALEGSPWLVVVSTTGVLISLVEVLESSEGATLEPSV